MYGQVSYAVVALLVSLFLIFKPSAKRRPPGPKRWPVIGNLLQMPKEREWTTFSSWSKTYGDCIYLTILGQPILILNSLQAASDLLEHRSSIYSSRPRLVMAGDLTGFDQALALMPYTERFRQIRQLLKRELSDVSLKKYWPLHEEESRLLMKNILSDPSHLADCVRHYSGSVILKVTYGYRTAARGDPFLLLAEKVMAAFSEASQPGNWLVDILPWMRHIPDWMPGATFKRKAAEWSKLHLEVIQGPYDWAKAHQNSDGLITPNFTTTILSNHGDTFSEAQDSLLLWASASLFGGGADTTVAAISSFFLAMALHPDVQRQGQKEIDSLLHGQRLPKLEDLPSLPFVENIVREVLRWNPVTPLGVPHLLSQEDVYNGYHIPKGTIVMPNIWLMLHNPEVYPDPEKFLPSRFSGNNLAINNLKVAFGFGRRACPGVSFAESSIFIAIATALSICDISNAVDETGSSISTDVLYKTGTISHPPKFMCTIKSRSDAAGRLLERTLDEEKRS